MDLEKIVREYIDKTIHMSLATVSGAAPWVSELHFAYDDKLNLYWRSLTSRRHSKEIIENQKVAGNIIDKLVVGEDVIGLYFEGVAEILEAGTEQKLAAQCLASRLIIDENEILEEAMNEAGHQFYKISVKNWYAFGKFGSDCGQKLKLEWDKNE